MKRPIIIILFLFAIFLFVFTGYILITGNRDFVPHTQLLVGGVLFFLGIFEFRQKRRRIATIILIGSFLCAFAGILSFMIKS